MGQKYFCQVTDRKSQPQSLWDLLTIVVGNDCVLEHSPPNKSKPQRKKNGVWSEDLQRRYIK